MGILVVALATWIQFARIDADRLKPDAWLAIELASGRSDASRVLLERFERDSLSSFATSSLINYAIGQIKSDPGAWEAQWGSVFETAWKRGVATPAHMERYAKGAFSPVYRHRTTIPADRPLLIAEFVPAARVVGVGTTGLDLQLISVHLDGAPLLSAVPREPSPRAIRAGTPDWIRHRYRLSLGTVSPGQHTLTFTARLRSFDLTTQQPIKILDTILSQEDIIQIVPPDTSIIRFSTADSLSAITLQKHMRIAGVNYQNQPTGTQSARTVISLSDLPMSVAFQIVWIVDGMEIEAGYAVAAPGSPALDAIQRNMPYF